MANEFTDELIKWLSNDEYSWTEIQARKQSYGDDVDYRDGKEFGEEILNEVLGYDSSVSTPINHFFSLVEWSQVGEYFLRN